MSKQYSPYPFRMPAEIREMLEEKATEAGRSLQQEMLRRIELTLKLEGALKSRVNSIDGLHDLVFDTIMENKKYESQIRAFTENMTKLQEQNRVLAMSTRLSEEQRFDGVRRNLSIIRDALEKAEKSLPPQTEEPFDKRPSYNPNKKPT